MSLFVPEGYQKSHQGLYLKSKKTAQVKSIFDFGPQLFDF